MMSQILEHAFASSLRLTGTSLREASASDCVSAAPRADYSDQLEIRLSLDSTLLKGLTVLEALIRSDRPRRVSEFAVELGLTKSNVHRVLQTLQAAGFVMQTPEGRYAPTLKIWELGSRVHLGLDVAREARPYLGQLAASTRETVHLSILDKAEVVYIDKIDSPEPVRAYSTVGGRAPAHCVATGKVLLAFAPSSAVHGSFASFTPRTIITDDAFQVSCAEIRSRNYAVNWGEWRERVRGVAAPVRDTFGQVIAAVGISGPAERLTRARVAECVPAVLGAAERISQALGFRAGTDEVRRRG